MLAFFKVAFFWILIMALIFVALLLLSKLRPGKQPTENDENNDDIQDSADE